MPLLAGHHRNNLFANMINRAIVEATELLNNYTSINGREFQGADK